MKIEIEIGAMCTPISQQLADMGLEQTGKSVELLDRLASATTLLHLHDCLTDAECQKARGRLMKQIRVRKIEASSM